MDQATTSGKKKWNLSDLGTGFIFKNISFLLFLAGLVFLYIANSHIAEKRVRDIYTLKSECKELRFQYMTLKSDVMHNSTFSEISKEVEPLGLTPAKNVPKKIEVQKN